MTRPSGTHRILHNSHWGPFQAVIGGGTVLAAEPALGDEDPAAMLASIPGGVHASNRVRRPAVRAGWLRDRERSDGSGRGVEPMVEVSWDDALELVAGELSRVRDRYGYESIFGGSYGWASAGRFHHAKTQLNRFLGLFGGYTGQVGNYSYATASVVLPYVVGDVEAISSGVTSYSVMAEHTDLWVMFGGAPLRTAQVESGGMRRHRAREAMRQLRASGTEAVLVGPLRDDAAGELGATWFPVRPGTDTALLLALTHHLAETGQHDPAFLERYCVGWEHQWEYLAGHADGVVKDAEWAGPICGLEPRAIRDLADRMARGRTMLSATWALQRAEHGEQTYWALITLAAALGQIGLPGGGFGFGYGDTSLVGQPGLGFASPGLRAGANPAGSSIPVARIADMLLHPGAEYEFDGGTYRYPHVRLVYWAGGNPFHHHQDLNRLCRAWQRPETIVVNEPWWTPTAKRADIVLPATTTLERNDISSSSKDSAITAMYQVLEPVAEARNDHDIFRGLAALLGFEKGFTEGRDELDWLRHLYEAARLDASRVGQALPAFDEFWRLGVVDVPPRPPRNLFGEFRADPEGRPLHTPSGRIELYSSTVASLHYAEVPGHAAWRPPTEYLGAPLARQFPLHLVSNQPATRLHSQLDMSGASQAAKIQGREPCRMHPDDARERGLATGDLVRLFNRRGSCLAGLIVSQDVRPGVVQLSTGAWFDPLDPQNPLALEVHGNPNVLTFDRGSSRLTQGPCAHTTLVQVERFRGEAPPVRAHQPPEFAPGPLPRSGTVPR